MTQYAQSDGDNKSEASLKSSSRFNNADSSLNKITNKNGMNSGF